MPHTGPMAQLRVDTTMEILRAHNVESRAIDGDSDHVMAEATYLVPGISPRVETEWEIVACDIDSLRDWLGY